MGHATGDTGESWTTELDAILQEIHAIDKVELLTDRWGSASYESFADAWNTGQRSSENMARLIQSHYWLIQEIDENDSSTEALADRAALVASLKHLHDLLDSQPGMQLFEQYAIDAVNYYDVALS